MKDKILLENEEGLSQDYKNIYKLIKRQPLSLTVNSV